MKVLEYNLHVPEGWLLTTLIFVAAALYSSVGHAGASGYLAAMALAGLAPEAMKPSALALNILVATIATARYVREGCFRWRTFWPFAAGSVPFAFLGGAIPAGGLWYKPALGAVLLFSAIRIVRAGKAADVGTSAPPPVAAAAICGVGIGLLAGLTGTGGGIFLSPLLLLAGWAGTRETLGISSAFILINSVSGLAGAWGSWDRFPAELPYWAVAAVAGGFLGTELGSRRLGTQALRGALGVVLAVAGLKLILAR